MVRWYKRLENHQYTWIFRTSSNGLHKYFDRYDLGVLKTNQRVTTATNLQTFQELFTDCYEKTTECYVSPKILCIFYDQFTCKYEYLRISNEYPRVLTIYLAFMPFL